MSASGLQSVYSHAIYIIMRTHFLIIALLLTPLMLSAQEESKPAEPVQEQFSQEYLLLIAESIRSFQARDFKSAINYVDKADAMRAPTVWTLNTRGAVAIEQKQYEEGIKHCLDALKLDKNFFPAKFNLCEIPFLQGKYDEARKMWNALLDMMGLENAVNKSDGTRELLTYRIFLTYLLEDKMDEAKKQLDSIPFPSQTPAYQYAHAAWARKNNDLDKWKEWVQSAEFIWPEIKRANFVDVLIHIGWMQGNTLGN
jgi:tetratricopeptide (TPR) repeat protein